MKDQDAKIIADNIMKLYINLLEKGMAHPVVVTLLGITIAQMLGTSQSDLKLAFDRLISSLKEK